MFSRRAYSPTEVNPGLAVFLSPASLREQMMDYTHRAAFLPPTGLSEHYFLVLARCGDLAAIVPLTSHPSGAGWKRIEGKRGHPGWVDEQTHYHPSQLWPITVEAVIAAARAAGDLTELGCRNIVIGKELDAVIEAMITWRDRQPRRVDSGPSAGDGAADANGLLPCKSGPSAFDQLLWRLFWAQYPSGEIWRELRHSSVYLRKQRIRRVTGKG
jgi:hypothetical protein